MCHKGTDCGRLVILHHPSHLGDVKCVNRPQSVAHKESDDGIEKLDTLARLHFALCRRCVTHTVEHLGVDRDDSLGSAQGRAGTRRAEVGTASLHTDKCSSPATRRSWPLGTNNTHLGRL